jgi:general secretion pathway protein D
MTFLLFPTVVSHAAKISGSDQPVSAGSSLPSAESPAKEAVPSDNEKKPEAAPLIDLDKKVMKATPSFAVPDVPSGEQSPQLPEKNSVNAEMPAQKEPTMKQEPRPASRSSAAKHKNQAAEKFVTIDFDNVDIGVFIKFVSELTGKNFIIDDKVKGKVTIVSPRKIPLQDIYRVFLSVLEVNGFTTVPAGDMVKVIPAVLAREKSVETRFKKEVTDPDDRMVTQVVTLERANPDEIKRVLDPIISRSGSVLSYPPAGMLVITDFLSNIKRLTDIISALDVEGAGDQISYIPLQNASVSEVVKSLTTIFQQRRANTTPMRAVADSRTNSIIILASVSDTENVRKLVAFMDKDVPRGESNIQVYRLQNSNAEDLAKVLNNIIKETAAAPEIGRAHV